MSCYPSRIVALTALALMLAGCYPTRPFYLNDRGDLSYYIDQATDIEYPDVDVASLEEVTQAPRPITVVDPDFQSFMDLSLEECVSISLQNSKVLRGYGTPNLQGSRVAPGVDTLANGPAAAGTLYNVAVRETEPGFIGQPGQISNPSNILTNTGLDVNQGVEAALADFDTQFTASAFWSTNDEPRNSDQIIGGFLNPVVFQQDTVNWQAELAKKTANGTQLFFRNTNQYIENNNPLVSDVPPGLQVLDSFYRTAFEFEVRQPLMRGRGAFIQRMPVVISRIGTDQELANLEAQLQNMVTNVEIRYWDLYCAYRTLEFSKKGRDAALQTWRIVYDQFEEGADVNIQQVAQASEQYHFFDAQVIDSYNNLLVAESDLRWLLGLATTDGRVIRPVDEATTAPVEFDWCSALDEAMTYRPELRQQRWEVKKRQLAVAYAKNSLLPQLDVTALYRFLGLGNYYATGQNNPQNFPDPTSGALNDVYGGDYQEFALGISYGIPIGLRRELSNVRNSQIKLARDVARLEDQELDVTREISEAFRALDANRRIMQSSFNRWKDTRIEEEHFEEIVELGLETLDVALDAQRRKTQAAAAFYNALCEYNKVIALIHRRKGTILAYSGVHFAEGPWAGKAYQDAEENARRRGASRHINYGWTRPQVISQGSIYPPAEGCYGDGCAVPANHAAGDQGYIGQPISTEYYGHGSYEQVIPGSTINGSMPYNGTTPAVPNSGTPVQPQVLPPPANGASKPIVPGFVQQVGYQQPVNQTTRRSQRTSRDTDANVQLSATTKALPRSDRNAPPPAKLERSSAPVTARPAESQATGAAATQPAASSQRPAATRAMNWEQFGLTRPQSHTGSNQAAIREQQ